MPWSHGVFFLTVSLPRGSVCFPAGFLSLGIGGFPGGFLHSLNLLLCFFVGSFDLLRSTLTGIRHGFFGFFLRGFYLFLCFLAG